MNFKNAFITKTKLESGAFYLVKDGRIICYMGQNVDGEYVFIDVISTVVVENWMAGEVHIKNEELLMPVIIQAAELVKDNPDKLEEYSIRSYKGIPSIYGKIDYIPVIEDTKGFVAQTKYTKKMAGYTVKNEDMGYISAKNLEVGRIYGDWRNWHIYLGRNSEKEFCWLYCGLPETLKKDGIAYLDDYLSYFGCSDLQTTKNNKKIKLNDELKDVCLDLTQLNAHSKSLIASFTWISLY